jgi:ABC-2 type transport system permease protein
MSTIATPIHATAVRRSFARTVVVYWKEAKYEFLKLLRIPMYSASVLLFPLMFYVLFGLAFGKQQIDGVRQSAYLLATYGTFGVMGASLFGTGASMAAERGLGWMQVKRASPMPPFAYFAAKIAVSVVFSTLVVVLLTILGLLFGGVHMAPLSIARLLATLIAGCIPFCALGLVVGYFAGPNSAPATINLIYLPMSFCSGLWVPHLFLPKFVQQIAQVLPSYHLSQMALGVVGAGRHESSFWHWGIMLAAIVLCLGAARLGFRRDEGRLYG